MKDVYRVHTVKAVAMEMDDPFRIWDESTFDTFKEAMEAYDTCCPVFPSIYKDSDPRYRDPFWRMIMPLEVFLTFSNATYRKAGEGYCIDKGIGVIRRKTVHEFDRGPK